MDHRKLNIYITTLKASSSLMTFLVFQIICCLKMHTFRRINIDKVIRLTSWKYKI